MLKVVKFFSTVLLNLVILSGCATIWDPVAIPNYQQTILVYPSTEHVSTFTETPGTDHLVDDSQVFLAGKNGFSKYFGVLGMSIDKARNSSSSVNQNETLNVKFDSILGNIISKRSYIDSPTNRAFSLVSEIDKTDLILLPSVRLLVTEDQTAQAAFRLTVRFVDPSTSEQVTKDYFYHDTLQIPITGSKGWASDKAKILKQQAVIAFNELVDVLSKDMLGQYEKSLADTKKPIISIQFLDSEEVIKAKVIDELDNRILVSYVWDGRVLRTSMSTISKSVIIE